MAKNEKQALTLPRAGTGSQLCSALGYHPLWQQARCYGDVASPAPNQDPLWPSVSAFDEQEDQLHSSEDARGIWLRQASEAMLCPAWVTLGLPVCKELTHLGEGAGGTGLTGLCWGLS